MASLTFSSSTVNVYWVCSVKEKLQLFVYFVPCTKPFRLCRNLAIHYAQLVVFWIICFFILTVTASVWAVYYTEAIQKCALVWYDIFNRIIILGLTFSFVKYFHSLCNKTTSFTFPACQIEFFLTSHCLQCCLNLHHLHQTLSVLVFVSHQSHFCSGKWLLNVLFLKVNCFGVSYSAWKKDFWSHVFTIKVHRWYIVYHWKFQMAQS